MDLRLPTRSATPAERTAVDAVLGPATSGWHGGEFRLSDGHGARGGHEARGRRHLLLPALHAIQQEVGWVSEGALGYVCERLTIPPAEAYGVASFYSLFSVEERPAEVVHACDDVVCAGRGAEDLIAALEVDGRRVVRSSCLGRCDAAPAALVQATGSPPREVAPADVGLNGVAAPVVPQDRASVRLLRRVGLDGGLAEYLSSGGYRALDRAIELGPDEVLSELQVSGLRGRGGAAFPIAAKWRGVRDAQGALKHVVANGDESEPGTFKDRVLMEGDPFALVEALTIAGLVTGSSSGYVYIRGEYSAAIAAVQKAMDSAREAGYLGGDVAGSGTAFDIEVRVGAGAYICGEETSLFASIEGYRGEPRQKPPFPTTHGLFGRPTAINNIETLAAVLEVIQRGGEAFAAVGSDASTGSKLFALSGDVGRPGVYEVPFGTTLGELLDLAGGVTGSLGAVLLGGAAGVFVDAAALEMPLTLEAAAAAGATLGSGAVVVFDDATDFGPVVRRIAAFFRDESCGQCVPCRVGTVRQQEALTRLGGGRPHVSVATELVLLADVDAVMTDASICGLGRTAASAVRSALALGLAGVVG